MSNQNIRQDNMQTVLEVTEKCLKEYGIEKTTIELIAEKSNISSRSIHRYYGSRDALIFVFVEKFMERYYQHIMQNIKKERNVGKSGLMLIKRLFEVAFEFYRKEFKSSALLAGLEMHFSQDKVNENLFSQHMKNNMAMIAEFQKVIKIGISDGSIRSDLDYDIVSQMIVNAYTALIRRIALIMDKPEYDKKVQPVKQIEVYIDMVILYLQNDTRETGELR